MTPLRGPRGTEVSGTGGRGTGPAAPHGGARRGLGLVPLRSRSRSRFSSPSPPGRLCRPEGVGLSPPVHQTGAWAGAGVRGWPLRGGGASALAPGPRRGRHGRGAAAGRAQPCTGPGPLALTPASRPVQLLLPGTRLPWICPESGEHAASVRVLEVEMHTQLNCQSKQTNTKLIFIWKRAIPRSRGLFENKAAKRLLASGMETSPRRRGLSTEASRGSRGSHASSPLATRSSGTGESGNLPLSGISTRAFSFALSLQARCLALPSRCSRWHRGSTRDLGTATAAPRVQASRKQRLQPAEVPQGIQRTLAIPFDTRRLSQARNHLIIYPLPRNHLIDKSGPLKRT
ncbi:uncharacterized protein J5F26_014843 [Ciconia maguari]